MKANVRYKGEVPDIYRDRADAVRVRYNRHIAVEFYESDPYEIAYVIDVESQQQRVVAYALVASVSVDFVHNNLEDIYSAIIAKRYISEVTTQE